MRGGGGKKKKKNHPEDRRPHARDVLAVAVGRSGRHRPRRLSQTAGPWAPSVTGDPASRRRPRRRCRVARSSDVNAVQIWLRWSVPWWSAWASRTPSGARLSDPSSRCRTTTRSGVQVAGNDGRPHGGVLVHHRPQPREVHRRLVDRRGRAVGQRDEIGPIGLDEVAQGVEDRAVRARRVGLQLIRREARADVDHDQGRPHVVLEGVGQQRSAHAVTLASRFVRS